jgi:hypothetical protein
VTLVVSMLRVSPGATLTAIGWTFGVFDCGTFRFALVLPAPGEPPLAGALAAPGLLAAPACDELAGEPPPPPPQPVNAAQTRKRVQSRAEGFMVGIDRRRIVLMGVRLPQVVRGDAGR